MQQTAAFLSEWGNDTLDFSKRNADAATTHFIVTAIIVSKDDMAIVKQVLQAVRGRHFEGGAIDSDCM